MNKIISFLAGLIPRKLSSDAINAREIERLTIERMFALDHVEYCQTELRKAQVELEEVEKAISVRVYYADFGELPK